MERHSFTRTAVTGNPAQLSTRTSLFSTDWEVALHVRDIDFVRLFHICTYIGTGADSRVGLASAPAFPSEKPMAAAVSMAHVPLFPTAPRRAALSRSSLSRSRVSVTV